jgi:hypothetical protein
LNCIAWGVLGQGQDKLVQRRCLSSRLFVCYFWRRKRVFRIRRVLIWCRLGRSLEKKFRARVEGRVLGLRKWWL